MTSSTISSNNGWKWAAIVAISVALAATVALTLMLLDLRRSRITEERLIGTWRSDADRTIAELPANRSLDEKQEAALRQIFGKMQVTYTAEQLTTELNGHVESRPYQVLGKDRTSVVIREVETQRPPILDDLELSEFAIIHFDGPDSFWVNVQLGTMREYFQRVK